MALDYRRPPSWRVPVAIATAVVLLAGVATILALNAIGDDAESEVSRTPIKTTGSKPVKGKDNGKAQPEETPAKKPPGGPAPASGAQLVKRGPLYTWPPELKAFTVVLLSVEDRASADRFARSASEGAPAKMGVIRADDFGSLPKGFFVVFAGQYKDRATADTAAARLSGRFSGSFPQLVAR